MQKEEITERKRGNSPSEVCQLRPPTKILLCKKRERERDGVSERVKEASLINELGGGKRTPTTKLFDKSNKSPMLLIGT